MLYKVLDTFKIGETTSVTIDGDGLGLQVGMTIVDSKGKEFKILSFAMDVGKSSFENTRSTTLLIKGEFTDSEFNI